MVIRFFIICVITALACKQKISPSTDLSAEEYSRAFEVNDSSLVDWINLLDTIEVLASGYQWAEGPVWVALQHTLLFSDVPENTIYAWSAGEGDKLYLKPSGFTGRGTGSRESGSNGLALDQEGRLILCQHGDRRIARMNTPINDPSPVFTTLADSYQGKKFNSPNDLCIARDGSILFTDPPYGLASPAEKELEFQGVYYWKEGVGVKLLVDSITHPNGIALSPDESKLYVANSNGNHAVWYVYDFDLENAVVSNGKIFFDATHLVKSRPGLPDGLKVHSSGLIFGTGPGGVHIFHPEGRHLGLIATNKPTANCAFDDREQYLYMTADDELLRIKIGRTL